ncbi:AAA family ATPase [Truepera radiovictrix]|uniref:ATPase associated with various cellular activities AAA_3 n=1 Tax=Truepera radiovictrix (strain DSM 17093 / CIP 108686 / LMG 22925 / RQ-24) TaxID=649638 RepID=D7CSW9_TRURR|nr:MoxR family ATPase [Truepera radiovictrix]ADI13736.1 ATPase associated with various cellular activities AAA_3 [Truepera radiovictrix DSM 17093]WMT57700.1 MoxR family ATPase [Truepera radiovictrix]
MTETTGQGRAAPTVFAERFKVLKDAIGEVIVGQEAMIEDLLIVVLAGGHALLEGAPGLGKTRLVRAFAEATDLSFGRIQFTPDLMPSDVTGTVLLSEEPGRARLEFQPGPVFHNVLLADEINRATPKTQSALLEAMQERSVTVAGTVHPLPRPFCTLATQNPLEMEGTYPLPEAQLDRFLFKLLVPRPDAATLTRILETTTGAHEGRVPRIFGQGELLELQRLLRAVPVSSRALAFVVELIEATHAHPLVRLGASPRGAQAIVLAAKGYALAAGRPNVELEDLRRAALPALRHRLLLSFEAEVEGASSDAVLAELLRKVGGVGRAGR